MWFRSLLQSLTRSSRGRQRRTADRKQQARRLFLESLEDRSLMAFVPAVSYPTGTDPTGVVAADFNGDGTLDLATADYSSNNVSVLLGNTNGTFQTAQDSTTGSGPHSLAVGDFDADGNLDLVTANSDGASVLLGNGNGTFQAPINIPIGPDTTSVAVGDFNNDGLLDLGVTSNYYHPGGGGCNYYGCWGYPGWYVGQVNVLLGTGGESFAPPTVSYLGSGYHRSAAVADFNADGKFDFAATSYESNYATYTVDVVLATGTGAFESPTAYSTGSYSQAVTVGDVTGDGILDLATAEQTIDILPGFGDGTFNALVVRQYIDPVALAAADFNGDGKLDLVAVEPAIGASVLLGMGTGTLSLPLNFTAGTSPQAVAAGDFNGDGRPDVAVANANSSSLSVLLNDGTWPALDAPSISITDASVKEGNVGTVGATFTVSLAAHYDQTVTVHYDTQDGSATVAGGDYQELSGMLTFGPGVTTQPITVLVNGDRLAEYGKFFSVRLTNPTNAFVAEGNSGSTAMNFTVTLSAPYDIPITVDFATADNSATVAGGDYQATADSVTFAIGQTTQTIPIAVNGDRLGENDETFYVQLTGATSAGFSDSSGYGLIRDDEPRVSIGDASVVEGDSGTKLMNFTVTLSAAYDQTVTVNYATQDGSALAGSDYVATTGSLTFEIGQTTKTFTVAIKGDKRNEYDEGFYVLLNGTSSNALIAYAYGYGTILNDDFGGKPH